MPQWNCACPNCRDARLGQIPARSQSSVAIGDHLGNWYLVNASPDLASQINSFPALQPRPTPLRNSPLATILLTNADLDHALGLFSLREGGRLRIFAPHAVQHVLAVHVGLDSILNAFCGADWIEPPLQFAPLEPIDPATDGLSFRAIPLAGGPPLFAGNGQHAGTQSVAYQFHDPRTGGRLIIAPDVAEVSAELLTALQESDAVLFDGTFWSRDELQSVKAGARTPGEMGHVTIRDSSLDLLSKLPARKKIYVHINNTNPVLAAASPERAAVEAVGITIGADGMEFDV